VAALLGDWALFRDQIDRAGHYASTPMTLGELTGYADTAYIASEHAEGLLVLGEPEIAAETRAGHIQTWALQRGIARRSPLRSLRRRPRAALGNP